MATTPTYSWPIPDNTDLVKDGAEAIRDLGNAIDTTVDGLPGAGLVHIETQSPSAVTEVSFNNVFSAHYNNYAVLMGLTTSPAASLTLRLRSGTTNESAGTHQRQRLQVTGTTVAGTRTNNQTSFALGNGRGNMLGYQITLFNPFMTQRSNCYCFVADYGGDSTNTMEINEFFGVLNNATSYDGFSVLSTTNMTGKISVYGYKL